MRNFAIILLCIFTFSCTTNSAISGHTNGRTDKKNVQASISQDEENILTWADPYFSNQNTFYPVIFDLQPSRNIEWTIHDQELILHEIEDGFVLTNTSEGGSGLNLRGDYQVLDNFVYEAELTFLESENPSTARFVFNEQEGKAPNSVSFMHDGTIILQQENNDIFRGKVEGIKNNEKTLLQLISFDDFFCIFVNCKPVCLVQTPGKKWSSGYYHWRITNRTKVLYSFMTARKIIEDIFASSPISDDPYAKELEKLGNSVMNNEPVFYDDFIDNRHDWTFIAGSPDGKDLFFENGSMHLSAGGGGSFMQRISPAAPPAIKDFLCEIDMSIINGKEEFEREWRFFCRRGPDSTHDKYRIRFDFGHGSSSIFITEEDRQPWQPESENAKIRIFVIGNRISVLQNGILVYDHTDPDSKKNPGEWFLGCSGGTPGQLELAFHALKIIEL